jgi:Ser/Thr protein kinase RdoA (MazF antagonist)
MNNDSILQKRIEKYVSARLLKQLDCRNHSFSLQKMPLGRMSNSTFSLEIDGYPPLILKAFPRRYRFKRLLRAKGTLVHHNIPVPNIVFAEEDRKLFDWKGMHVICEERIEGSTLLQVDLTPQIIKDIAHLFLRLHRIKRTLWGKLNGGGRSDSLFFHLNKNIQMNLWKWRTHDQSFPSALANSIVDYGKPFQREVERINTFSLCHNDPTKANIILDKNKSLYLIDIDEMGYFPPFMEYYMAQLYLLEGNEAKIRLFEEAYMQGLSLEEKQEMKIAQPFFKLFVLVRLAERFSKFSHLNSILSLLKKEIERTLT